MDQDSSGTRKMRHLPRETRNLIFKIGLVGITLLTIAVFAPPLISEEYHSPGFDLAMELIKDVGIAFVVAAIVGGVFEVGARSRLQEAMVSGTVHAILGSWIGPDIWQDVQKQIIGRKALRKNLDIQLRLFEGSTRGLPDNVMVLWTRGEYDLYSKEANEWAEIEVSHRLQHHATYGDLPRFLKQEIRGNSFSVAKDENRKFRHKVWVEGRDGNPVHIVLEREELVYLPGSYSHWHQL